MNSTVVIGESPQSRFEIDFLHDKAMVRLIGLVNERMDFPAALEAIGDNCLYIKTVVFDLARVSSINSLGVRGWIQFISQLQATYAIRFSVVSEAMIEQAAIVPNLLGKKGTPIEAIEVPYSCSKCKSRISRQFQIKDLPSGGAFSAPTVGCENCDEMLEFDAQQGEYAAVLKWSVS